MVEEHSRTHSDYRDWCPDCRAGKSTGLHHRRGDPDEEKLGATISVDYAFQLKEEQEDDLIPVLVAYDNVKESIWTFEVEEKGISNASVAVDWLVGKLDASGSSWSWYCSQERQRAFDYGIEGRCCVASQGGNVFVGVAGARVKVECTC